MNDRRKAILTENAILYMGIPIKMAGYGYICEAVAMAMDDGSRVPAITKEVYPVIAKKNGVTPSSVEKCIRQAIEHAWKNDKIVMRDFLYENIAVRVDRRPTNSEFIALLIRKINLESEGDV